MKYSVSSKSSSTVSSLVSDLQSTLTLDSKKKNSDILSDESVMDKRQLLSNTDNTEYDGQSVFSYKSKSSKKYKENMKKKSKQMEIQEHIHSHLGPISLATLVEDGILIKSRKPTPFELSNKSNGRNSREFGINGRTSMSSSTTSFRSSIDSNNHFETASLISCVTCLSDDESSTDVSSDSSLETNMSTMSPERKSHKEKNKYQKQKRNFNTYTSVNGQLPTNTVIPYSSILNAKIIENNEKIKKLSIMKNLLPNQSIIEITFGKPTRHDVKPKSLTLLIESNLSKIDLIEDILQRSYHKSKRFRSILVIINPFGGKRNAKKIFKKKAKPLLLASNFEIDIIYTKYPGHATKIAEEMDINRFDTIACASGDGIPHEVINGLFRRADRVEAFNKLAVTQIPCGSGNAMSVSCHWTNNPSYATLFLIKSIEKRVDIMCCTQPSGLKDPYPKLSFLSQTYGIIAESDINTEFIRWMGPARFELGVAFNILQRKKYPCDIYVKYFAKSKNDLKLHYLNYKSQHMENDNDRIENTEFINQQEAYTEYDTNSDRNSFTSAKYGQEEEDIGNCITEEDFKIKYKYDGGVPDDWEKIDSGITNNLGIFYTGKMPYVAADTKFFPAALPADGCIDMVITDSRTPFTRMIPILLALDKGAHVLQPEVLHSKILAYKLIPKPDDRELKTGKDEEVYVNPDGLFSIDGEKFPLEPLQVEVLPRLCRTLLRDGRFVDTDFDKM